MTSFGLSLFPKVKVFSYLRFPLRQRLRLTGAFPIKETSYNVERLYNLSSRTPEINPWDNMGILGLTSKVKVLLFTLIQTHDGLADVFRQFHCQARSLHLQLLHSQRVDELSRDVVPSREESGQLGLTGADRVGGCKLLTLVPHWRTWYLVWVKTAKPTLNQNARLTKWVKTKVKKRVINHIILTICPSPSDGMDISQLL